MTQTATAAQDIVALASELEGRADLLHSALLAPSMRESALRQQAATLRRTAHEIARNRSLDDVV